MDMSEDDVRNARLRGRRAAHGLVLVVAMLFIGVSTAQIISAVFGIRTTPLASGPIDSPERRCALGISRLAKALDRAARAPAAEPGFRSEIPDPGGDWASADGVQRSCGQATGGLDAWAALLRLRQAQSQLARSQPDDLLPLRRDLAAHLPQDMR
jgi:hypothetical protein